MYKHLTFICPCIASISLEYNQQDATFSRSIYLYKLLYMFQAEEPPETCRAIWRNKQIEKTLHLAGCTLEMNIIFPPCLCQWTFYALGGEECGKVYSLYSCIICLFSQENLCTLMMTKFCNTIAANQFSAEQRTRILFHMLLPLFSNI